MHCAWLPQRKRNGLHKRKNLRKQQSSNKIRDKGCGIADIEKAMEPLFTTAPEEDRAGLGFAVMQSFCDKVKVKSTVGKGTAVTLEKVISSGRFLSRGR